MRKNSLNLLIGIGILAFLALKKPQISVSAIENTPNIAPISTPQSEQKPFTLSEWAQNSLKNISEYTMKGIIVSDDLNRRFSGTMDYLTYLEQRYAAYGHDTVEVYAPLAPVWGEYKAYRGWV